MKKIFFFLAAMALAITANAKVTTISPDAENDALRLAVHYAEDGDIIEMTEGTYVQCNNGYVAFDGKSVTVKAAEGANVVLQLQVPITLTNGGKATLQGIKIDASRLTELADWYEHVVYPTDATEGKELVMDGCELYGFNINKSAIYSSSSNTLALCDVKNCYFHDNMKSCFFFEGSSIAELSVVNSTFANIATDASSYYAGPIDVRNADAKVTIDHCTFYDCKAMSTDYATVTMKGPQAANVVISNNIFALSSDETAMRAIRNNVNAKNCLTFNYKYSSDSNPGLHSTVEPTDCKLNVDPKFVDAANGDFALNDGSPALGAGTDGSNLGDPRWNVVAEPEPVVYNVTVTAENGTVEGDGEYEEGATATLTATPAEGYEFVNWTVGEEVVSTENPYTFTVTADIALVANFQATEPVVELPAASVRAWAYDLALAVEGEQYTFSYKATTAALATLIFTDVDGEELATKDLGLVEAGANTVVLAADELPADQKVNWAVKLEAGAIANFVELTDASKGIYNFYLPQGVAVDNNPESATFGTIYVAAATDGASDGSSDRADTQKRGIFIYDQELNELNPTSNVGIVPSNVTFGATSRQVMKRLVINPATNEVAFAHNAAPMAVWAVLAENVGGEAKNLIEGLGFTNVNALCFDEEGTLYVMESNGYPAPGSLYKVVNGVVDTIFANNTRFGNADLALVSDNRGGIWICQNRSQLDTYNQLTHVNAAGEIDFEVNTATPNGFESKNTARGTIAYNPAEDILAMSIGTGSTIGASLFKVTYDETTGVPALTLIGSTPSMGKNVDGLAFDYAGDLYGLSANKERLYKYAVPTENNVCTTPAAAKYAFQLEAAVVEPVELVGVVKRALTIGESTVVLTHEADGTAHIYNIVGEEIAEISLEGVVPVNPDNLGDYLAISDIAVTEDGKLIATNYMMCQGGDDYVDAGYVRGENRFYIWNDLTGDPSLWFTSKMYSNWFRSKQGYTIAVKGTSQNAEIFSTGVHGQNGRTRFSWFHVIDGVYTEPGLNNNDYYHYHNGPDDIHASGNSLEAKVGTQYELNASPLAADLWIMDGNLVNPYEYVLPATNNVALTEGAALTEDLGKKYNGTTYLTIGEQAIMVAPYADAEGKLAGVKVLDITAGLASATEVAVADLDAAVEATAAATAVVVDEDKLIITLVGDATLYTLTAELTQNPGPGTALDNVDVEAKTIKMLKNGQLIIIKNGVQYNVQGQVIK